MEYAAPLLLLDMSHRATKKNAPASAFWATRGTLPFYSWADLTGALGMWLGCETGGGFWPLSKLFADRPGPAVLAQAGQQSSELGAGHKVGGKVHACACLSFPKWGVSPSLRCAAAAAVSGSERCLLAALLGATVFAHRQIGISPFNPRACGRLGTVSHWHARSVCRPVGVTAQAACDPSTRSVPTPTACASRQITPPVTQTSLLPACPSSIPKLTRTCPSRTSPLLTLALQRCDRPPVHWRPSALTLTH